MELLNEEIGINKINIATELAIEENKKSDRKNRQETSTQRVSQFGRFNEEKAAQFPESKSWDHKIKMKEGFEPKSFKNYKLTPAEQLELDNFLEENLEKRYIRPSM